MSPKVKFEVEGWECLRCGHKWIPRIMTDVEPTICPKCKSPYWDKPRRNEKDDKSAVDLAHQSMMEKKKRGR
jgi:hypothetical protein